MTKPRIINRLPQFVDAMEIKAQRGMTQALILGASEATSMTPIDTSTLINSQFKDVRKEGVAIVGTVGYTAEYALAVHEASGKLKGQPRADFGTTSAGVSFGGGSGRGNYWDPDAEPKFLAKGFENAADNIHRVLTGAIKT